MKFILLTAQIALFLLLHIFIIKSNLRAVSEIHLYIDKTSFTLSYTFLSFFLLLLLEDIVRRTTLMLRNVLIAKLCIKLGTMITCLEFTIHELKGESGVQGHLALTI